MYLRIHHEYYPSLIKLLKKARKVIGTEVPLKEGCE
jgi:hypothetical protein